MTDELTPTEGMNRREMLKRSAVVGGAGALMWAAPTVTAFGPRAFAQDGSPASDFSNFGAIVRCDRDGVVTFYRVKGEESGPGTAKWVDAGNSLGGCEQFVAGWGDATKAIGSELGMTFEASGSNYIMRLNGVPVQHGDCTFDIDGGAAASLKQGQCCIGGHVSADGQSITWFGPFPNGSPQQPCSGHPDNLPL